MADLLWRHAVSGSDEWSPLLSAPAANRGFTEAGRYLFRQPSEGWSLIVDDEPLLTAAESRDAWLWQPGFYAGEVTAELRTPAGSVASLFLLDVAPDPTKIGRDVFGKMLDELWSEEPALVIGEEPATQQIGQLGALEDPWLAFARLRRYAPEFVRALAAVRAAPRRRLRARRDSVALHEVRRVDRHSVAALVRGPGVALFSGIAISDTAVTPRARLDVPVVEETVDSPANRALLAVLLAVRQRARVLLDRLQTLIEGESESDTRTALAARWPIRRDFLAELIGHLERETRRWPFFEIRRPEITAAGLTGIAADPAYARAYGRGWRALRYGVEEPRDEERLWISPTWEIYERWCFVRLGRLLCETYPAWRWRRRTNPNRWVGEEGSRRAELVLQRTFPSSAVSMTGPWSVSRQRVPDIVFSVADRAAMRFVVLDAKYRTSRQNVLDAMASAHIYQDALRIGRQRPEGSFLLVPSGGGAGWLESPEFHQEHRVGVVVLSPDNRVGLPPAFGLMLGASGA